MKDSTKTPQTLKQKVDELIKQVNNLSRYTDALINNVADINRFNIKTNAQTILKIVRANEKYNAKLRLLDQNEAKFYRWNNLILLCAGMILTILMWWCI